MRLPMLIAALLSPIAIDGAAAQAPAPPVAAAAPAVLDKPADDDSVALEGTTAFDMTSRAGGAYEISVYWPDGDPPAAGWPVLYILDGAAYFPVVATMAGNMGGSSESGIEPGVVVAIGYPEDARRDVDYTPRTPPRPADADPYIYPTYATGGADAFLAFIEDELKPRIAARWRIDPARQTLAGHGYGGLFALHALFTRPESFTTYVASSPSIWFMGRAILAEERAFLARPSRPEGRLLAITGAEYAQSLPPRLAIAPDADARLIDNSHRRMVDNGREMAWRLQHAGVRAEWRFFAGESQGSAAYPGFGHAVALAFRPRD